MTIYFLKDVHGRYYNNALGFNADSFDEAAIYDNFFSAKCIKESAPFHKKVYIYGLDLDERHFTHCG